MKLNKYFYDSLDYMVELKAHEVRDFVASSEIGKELQAEINRLVENLKDSLDNKNFVVLSRLEQVFSAYIQEATEKGYMLGLCDAININIHN